jgi:hypothetical protein
MLFLMDVLCISTVINLYIIAFDVMQLDKYKNVDFSRCPRVNCSGQPCLPVGQSDIPRSSTVKIYCPRCEDIYTPRSKYLSSILSFSIKFVPTLIGLLKYLPLCDLSVHK